MKYQFFIFLFFYTVFVCASVFQKEEQDFITSFVDNYGFSTNARDTRDYHSFTLAQTRKSFSELEQALQKSDFDLCGRIVVCGYQEDAIPSYQTQFNRVIIDDEVATKTNVGWKFPAGNLFGFATGFLLKECNQFSGIFEHIARERVDLFARPTSLLHEHAFGAAYSYLYAYQYRVHKALRCKCKDAQKKVIKHMHDCWQELYINGWKDGSGALIAPQNILFSVHYARYLMNSVLPLDHFFIGPDITYPIEVVPCQPVEATRAAQTFVQRFVHCLQPRDNKKTAYVLCSFTDGVGKSTLLGNTKNWLRHGASFKKYERVDNSSTQEASVFKVNDDVCLVDLPAQVSHFLVKPDGYVYVDATAVKELDQTKQLQIIEYIYAHLDALEKTFFNQIKQLRKSEDSSILQPCEDDSPEFLYAKNVVLLRVDSVEWIPAVCDNVHILFHKKDPKKIRILVPLEGVHSRGLKVVNPEQMLFQKGLLLPLRYDVFLDDLIKKLKQEEVQKIVFVDFMSMYPRTSRENIRVNFLLQQLSLIFGDLFDIKKSAYQHFVSPHAIYALLCTQKKQIHTNMVLEAGVRWGLYHLINICMQEGVTRLPLSMVHTFLATAFSELHDMDKKKVCDAVHAKIQNEIQERAGESGLSKEFESVVRFSFEPLIHFSEFLQKLFTQKIGNYSLNNLWNCVAADCADNQEEALEQGALSVDLVTGSSVSLIAWFKKECRDKVALKKCISTLRAQWYATLSMLLEIKSQSGGMWYLPDIKVGVPPLVVKSCGNEWCCFVTPHIIAAQKKANETICFNGVVPESRKWGTYDNQLYCLDWSGINTHTNMYAFGYNTHNILGTFVLKSIDTYAQQHGIKDSHTLFMPTTDVATCLQYDTVWQAVAQELIKNDKQDFIACPREVLQLFVRALATLEMILPDCDAPIMVRKGCRSDFIAAVHLIEKVVLPVYFKLFLTMPLFEDYSYIEPVVLC